jgi:hypothetical protein
MVYEVVVLGVTFIIVAEVNDEFVAYSISCDVADVTLLQLTLIVVAVEAGSEVLGGTVIIDMY